MPILNIKDLIEKVRTKVCSGIIEDQTFIAELCVLCDFATAAEAKLPILGDELARVMAELDRTLGVKDRAVQSAAENKQEADVLRARVAELEKERERTTPIAKAACEEIDQLRARNAELLAALEWYVDTYAIPESDHKLGIGHLIDGEQAARSAIACVTAERDDPHYKGTDYKSITPAKHPDTERLDWLEYNTAIPYCAGLYNNSSTAAVVVPGVGDFTGVTIRAAIDAARKQGGET